ncbi:hypothetical protein Hanom_Chr15g01403371 [Helianthus anomalus]
MYAQGKVHEAEKEQSVEVPKAPEVQTQSVPEVEIQKKGGNDDYVEITGFRAATPPPPPPPPQDQPIPESGESSQPKNKDFSNMFGDLPHATGVYKDDLGLGDDFDLFNNATVKALEKKVGELEKENAKAEAERDVLKKQVEELLKTNEEIKTVMIKQEKKLKKLKDGVHDNSQLIEIKKAEERRVERERKLAEEATQRRKGLVVDTEEILGSSSQPAAGGSSSQADVDMVDAEEESKGFVIVEVLLLKWKDEEVVEEEEDEEDKIDDDLYDYIDNYPEGDDDDDQGSSGLLIVNPNFDIEDEIPPSPERQYEFKYAQEADKYDELIVEEASDSFDKETDFHYSGNEDEIRRKIVEKITTEGVPRTIPRENLAEERKKWFKVMPKERKYLRPLQYFTHNADISWGDILSWGYLEDLQVYAIRREQGVQYFEFLLDIKTLPW